jgi:hypothetical protein
MTIIQANDTRSVFNSLLYGHSSAEQRYEVQDRLAKYMDGIQQLGHRVGALAKSTMSYIMDDDRIHTAKQALRGSTAYLRDDVVVLATENNFRSLSPYMQSIIMENSRLKALEENGDIHGFKSTRLWDSTDDDFEQYIYSGYTDDREEHPLYISSDSPTYLDEVDKLDIIDSWNNMLHAISSGVVDPTSFGKKGKKRAKFRER